MDRYFGNLLTLKRIGTEKFKFKFNLIPLIGLNIFLHLLLKPLLNLSFQIFIQYIKLYDNDGINFAQNSLIDLIPKVHLVL